jgi:uncharacterized protein YdiU (UPF0061 family)
MIKMWSSKLGLQTFNPSLFNELMQLMIETSVDYTIFFRELSNIPKDISPLKKSFYKETMLDENLLLRWSNWLENWKSIVNVTTLEFAKELSEKMKQVNPKYILREWFLVPAYNEAEKENYELTKELQKVMNHPYDEQSLEIEEKFYRKKPYEFFSIAGISHVSCSS